MTELSPRPSLAPLWRRFAALTYDSLIITAIALGYSALLTGASVWLLEAKADNYQPMFSGFLPTLGLILSLSLYYGWFWRRSGQTIGMRAWRIQVVDESNQQLPPNWYQCIVRCAAGIPAFWLFGLGYWYKFMNPERACLHDKLSHTRVIQLKPDA